VCPKCGTRNLETAKFCKKDGVALRGSNPPVQPAVPRTTPLGTPRGRGRRNIILLSGAAAFSLSALAGGALYWTGYIGDRQGTIAQEINDELGGRGLGNVKVTVNKDWQATAKGLAANSAEKEQALALIKGHRQLKEPLSDMIRVRPTRAELQAVLNKAVEDTRIPQASAQIDETLTSITIGGADLGAEARAQIEQALTSALNTVDDTVQVRFVYSPLSAPTVAEARPADGETAKRALNEQLHAAGLSGVSGEFDTAGRVTLQGTVLTQQQHDRAVQIAASQTGVSGVIDLLQIAAPRSAVAARDPARLEGEINRLLRGNGLGGITALVADDFSVTLKGSANSAQNKLRAFQLLGQFPIKGTPRDRVFVVQ